MNELRFGVLVDPDAPFAELAERWSEAEELGFDQLLVSDHICDYMERGHHWHEGWSTLAAMAVATSRIRIGTLVSNPILRPPALLARAALSVDHLSEGRLDLGVGTGIADSDFAATGTPVWSAEERAERLDEYLTVVDGLLRSGKDGEFDFEGRYHRVEASCLQPPALQQPRPPITVGGQSPGVLRIAAAHADCWNTHGPHGIGLDEMVETTRRQNRELDELCEAAGREPGSLRRSVLLFASLAPWGSPGQFGEIVERFRDAGTHEFVVYWPFTDDELEAFEHVATHVIPRLRGH